MREHRGPVPDRPVGNARERRAIRIGNCIRFKFYKQGESWEPIFHRQAIAMCHEMDRRGRLRDDGTYIRVDRRRRGARVEDAARDRVTDAAIDFPAAFGLRDFPGQTFSIMLADSFVGNDGSVQLYVYAELDDGSWRAFARGTPEELWAQVVTDPTWRNPRGRRAAFGLISRVLL